MSTCMILMSKRLKRASCLPREVRCSRNSNIELLCSMFALERMIMNSSAPEWIGASRGMQTIQIKVNGKLKLIGIDRINLETDEQTVLSTHSAPVKAVIYSKDHCK